MDEQKQLIQQSKVFLDTLQKEADTTSKNPLVKPFFRPIKLAVHLLALLHARVSLLESKGA